MIKNDIWIKEKAIEENMIVPFQDTLIRQVGRIPVISYGLSSYGYDIRLSHLDFKILKHVPGKVVDPKDFDEQHFEQAELIQNEDRTQSWFILPAHSYGLGVSKERIEMPRNVTANCLGKSTYARCGIVANITPLEAGWQGWITLEFANPSDTDCKIYAGEGVAQLEFFEGEQCETSYADRKGKYNNQGYSVTKAKV